MKRAVIIGASSGIGRQVSQLLVQRGWHVALAARNMESLAQLESICPERIMIEHIDVNAADAPARLLALIARLGGMNLFFYAAGIGYINTSLNMEKETKTIETNVMGFTRMIDTAFHYFAESNGGHIAAITSIAGTKGLGPAPSYSAAKAFQSTYLQALEQMSNTRNLGIRITDVRPGFVSTPLISGHHFPMTMSAHHVAKHIIRDIKHRRHAVVIDWRWSVLNFFWRHMPKAIWRNIKLLSDKK